MKPTNRANSTHSHPKSYSPPTRHPRHSHTRPHPQHPPHAPPYSPPRLHPCHENTSNTRHSYTAYTRASAPRAQCPSRTHRTRSYHRSDKTADSDHIARDSRPPCTPNPSCPATSASPPTTVIVAPFC